MLNNYKTKTAYRSVEEAYAPDATRLARVSAPMPELDIALKVIADQRARIDVLENEIMTDSMTGILNRRGLMKALTREVGLANRFKETNALLVLFDLDGLKGINDRFGHLAGDAYITAFAEELRQCVRTTDYIGRLGGDEFALLMTDGDAIQMQVRIEDMIAHLNSKNIRYGDLNLSLAISHGSVLVAPESNVTDLIASADDRLYSCKSARKSEIKPRQFA